MIAAVELESMGVLGTAIELLAVDPAMMSAKARGKITRARMNPPMNVNSERTVRQLNYYNIFETEKHIIAGRRGGDRTRKPLRAGDFKSPVYTIPPPAHGR